MSGNCVAKIPHESCGSSDALQVYEDDGKISGYCWKCHTYVADPLGEGKTISDLPKAKLTKTPEEIAEEIEFIKTLKACDLKERRLRGDVLDDFGVKIGYSRKDGKTPEVQYFPYRKGGEVVRYKAKLLTHKAFWNIGRETDVDLFGWDEAIASGARRLIITEGENDAVAGKRIVDMHTKKDFEDNKPAFVSLINGSKSAGKDLARLASKIRKHFKEEYISFCFDDDEAGELAIEEACKIFPKAKSITLPLNDLNACLIKGKSKAAFNSLTFKAKKPKNTRLVWGRDVHDKAKVAAEWGLSTPWPTLTDLTRGFRFGETWYIAAGEKMGKSEIVNAIAAHFVKEHKLKVLLAKPEESNNKTYKMILSKLTSKVFHDPKVEFDPIAYEEGGKLAKENVCMLSLYQHVGWESLKTDITAAAAEGVKAVFIDPITNLTNGMSNSDIDSHLKGIAQELASMAMDLDIIIFIFCHLNKPPKGSKPWDRGGKITTDYFAGSSAMARSCNYAIGLQGNKDPELTKAERNTRQLVLLADREFGESGEVDLFWNDKTTQFTEV